MWVRVPVPRVSDSVVESVFVSGRKVLHAHIKVVIRKRRSRDNLRQLVA